MRSRATSSQASDAKGCFGGLAGPIAFAAEAAVKNTEANKVRWEKIPNYGRCAAGMSIFPVTAESVEPGKGAAPTLEYPVYIAKAGKFNLDTIIGPSLNYVPGRAMRVAIAVDNEPAEVISVTAKADAAASDRGWAASVENNARVLRSSHTIAAAGKHTLKVSMVDPGMVLQKFILSEDGKQPATYFGAPETKLNEK